MRSSIPTGSNSRSPISTFATRGKSATLWSLTALSAVLVLPFAVARAQSRPSLQFDPPSGTRLSSTNAAIDITLDISGYTWATLPWDWRSPTVVLDGRDISAQARSLAAGATGAVIDASQVVASKQTVTADSMTLQLSGMRLQPGFHEVHVQLDALGPEGPLEFQATYPVIAGQERQQ